MKKASEISLEVLNQKSLNNQSVKDIYVAYFDEKTYNAYFKEQMLYNN